MWIYGQERLLSVGRYSCTDTVHIPSVTDEDVFIVKLLDFPFPISMSRAETAVKNDTIEIRLLKGKNRGYLLDVN